MLLVKMLLTEERLNLHVSHLPGVHAVVERETRVRGNRARGVHSAHRKTGASGVDVYMANGGTDGYIVLFDRSPKANVLAMEYGWGHGLVKDKGGAVRRDDRGAEGLGILRAACL